MNRNQIAEQYKLALRKFVNSLSDDEALEVATVYPPFKINRPYKTGDFLTYGKNSLGDPQLYKVVQDHISSSEWNPSNSPSLYSPIGLNSSGVPKWSQPAGAYDAYNIDDIVDYNSVLYKSLINGNVWSPDIYPNGWEKVDSSNPNDISEWKQPTDSLSAYPKNAKVTYKGKTWISLYDNNVWEPGVYGWEEVIS